MLRQFGYALHKGDPNPPEPYPVTEPALQPVAAQAKAADEAERARLAPVRRATKAAHHPATLACSICGTAPIWKGKDITDRTYKALQRHIYEAHAYGPPEALTATFENGTRWQVEINLLDRALHARGNVKPPALPYPSKPPLIAPRDGEFLTSMRNAGWKPPAEPDEEQEESFGGTTCVQCGAHVGGKDITAHLRAHKDEEGDEA